MTTYLVLVEVRNPVQTDLVWESACNFGGRIIGAKQTQEDETLVYFGTQSALLEFEVNNQEYENFELGLRGVYGDAIKVSLIRNR